MGHSESLLSHATRNLSGGEVKSAASLLGHESLTSGTCTRRGVRGLATAFQERRDGTKRAQSPTPRRGSRQLFAFWLFPWMSWGSGKAQPGLRTPKRCARPNSLAARLHGMRERGAISALLNAMLLGRRVAQARKAATSRSTPKRFVSSGKSQFALGLRRRRIVAAANGNTNNSPAT